MTILVFCHSTRRAKKLGAIRTWCRQMVILIVLVEVPHIIQFSSTHTTFDSPFCFSSSFQSVFFGNKCFLFSIFVIRLRVLIIICIIRLVFSSGRVVALVIFYCNTKQGTWFRSCSWRFWRVWLVRF